jgi:hypothetical protein
VSPYCLNESVVTVRGMPYPSDLTDEQWDPLASGRQIRT